MQPKARAYLRTIATYGREACSLRHFGRLLRIRLSQSKVGPLVCPNPVSLDVSLRSFGSHLWLRSHTTDIVVLGELLEGRAYQPLVEAAGPNVRTIVDLGANTGLAARWLLHRFPSARLVAVEPEPGNVGVLVRNLGPLMNRAEVVPACIGAYERRVALVGTREDAFAMRDSGDNTGESDVVTMQAVLDRLKSDQIDVLKVDIEGAEEEVFAGCASWIGGVGVMSVECHHPFAASDLLRLLDDNGAELEVLSVSPMEFGYQMALLRSSGRPSQVAS